MQRGHNGGYNDQRDSHGRFAPQQELMRTPAGRVAWKTHGRETHMGFDLADGSESRRVLAAYLEAKGITI